LELDKLYQLYEANVKIDNSPRVINDNPIKVGDIVVALYSGREVRGEISDVYENYFNLKGKSGAVIKITLDDVTEHYPKNKLFENKTLKRFTETIENKKVFEEVEEEEEEDNPDNYKSRSVERPSKRKIINDYDDKQQKNNPDNQVDLTVNEDNRLKKIGKVIFYKDMKFSEVNNMFEKKLLSKETYWYLLTEKQGEIHVVRNNDKGFEIQPFATALVGHFLKQNGKLNEAFNQIKVKGNNNFSVISNIPSNSHKQLLNSLIGLLSGIKK
jgi:hypothetical protein